MGKDLSSINVVHYVHTWLPQTETWIYNQLRHLKRPIQSSVVCERLKNLDQFHLPDVFCIWRENPLRYAIDKCVQKSGLRRNLSSIIRKVKDLNADILHSHFANWGWTNIPVTKLAHLKHIVAFYGFDVNMLPMQKPIWYERYKEMFAAVDLILCEGPFMAECIVKLGCSKEKIRVQHLGVCVDEIRYQPRVWNKDEPLRILIAASFQEKKGIPYALEALGRLRDRLSFQLTIIGDANLERRSQEEKRRILDVIQKFKLQSEIRMLGWQPYRVLLEEAYKHHIFLAPSMKAISGDTEGGAPVIIAEMMATGMVVIASNHCDIPMLIQSENTGLLFEEKNVDRLIEQILWLKNQDTLKWNFITENARNHVEKNFNVKIQSAKLSRVYNDVLYAR